MKLAVCVKQRTLLGPIGRNLEKGRRYRGHQVGVALYEVVVCVAWDVFVSVVVDR